MPSAMAMSLGRAGSGRVAVSPVTTLIRATRYWLGAPTEDRSNVPQATEGFWKTSAPATPGVDATVMVRPDMTLGVVKSKTTTSEPMARSSMLPLLVGCPEGSLDRGMTLRTEKSSAETNRTTAAGARSTTATTCPAVVVCSRASLHATSAITPRSAARFIALS